MIDANFVKQIVQAGFPEAKIDVSDMTGTGDHFEILVISEKFSGKPIIEQHRMVHAFLEKEMNDRIHAVKIRTKTPAQAEALKKQPLKGEWSGRHDRSNR